MKHQMKLHASPYEAIKNKTKTIEMRLNDEKRKLINVGDDIEFLNVVTNESIVVNVIGLYSFNNFAELYECFDKISLGYKENEEAIPSDMEKYYSKQDIEKYGVLAIEIKKYSTFEERVDNTVDLFQKIICESIGENDGKAILREFGLDEETLAIEEKMYKELEKKNKK